MKTKFIFLLALLFGTAVFMTVRADPEPGPEPDADPDAYADADADPDAYADADAGWASWASWRPSHYNYRHRCSKWCPSGYSLDYHSCSCRCSRKCSYGYTLDVSSCKCVPRAPNCVCIAPPSIPYYNSYKWLNKCSPWSNSWSCQKNGCTWSCSHH